MYLIESVKVDRVKIVERKREHGWIKSILKEEKKRLEDLMEKVFAR